MAVIAEAGITKLSWKERIGYGAGDFAHNLVFHSILTYLTYFYTDVAGISASAVGIIYIATRVWDGVNDPVMGFIADHTRSRWGRFRPWLLFGAVPLAILLVLAFSSFDLPRHLAVAYAAVTYLLLGMVYTMVNIPYSSLTAVMTRDMQERTVLTSVRMLLSGAGMMTVIIATKPLVDLFPSEKIGYPAVMAFYGVVIVALNWYTFFSVKERVAPDAKPYPLLQSFRIIAHNAPLILLGLAAFAGLSALTIRNASIMYYFTYYLERDSLVPLFFTVTAVPAILSYIVSPWLSKKLGKKRTFILANAGGALSGFLLFFMTPENMAAIFVFSAFFNIFGAVTGVMTWAMLPDTVEYNQWKTGERADGAVYSVFSLSQKLAMAAGGGIIGLVLSLTGYVPRVSQTTEALAGIRGLFALAPALFSILAVVIILAYPITTSYYENIMKEISESIDNDNGDEDE